MEGNVENKNKVKAKGFLGRLFEKIGKKMEENAKSRPCCCCKPSDKEDDSCCS